MKKTHLRYSLICLGILVLGSCGDEKIREFNSGELVSGFELLSPEETGIDFNNKLQETETFNHYFYSQIYVGSGVAIGDINNDGLPDVFFGGNQVSDRLYLNKGDFKFEDITKTSKTGINPGWTWGVTMADVNADGYLDIYVSRNGNSSNKKDRRNLLYINNQDLTFTESAIQYGLADVGFSTQAIFFDMDNDGDLDMYQVNQVADKKLLLINKIPRDQFKYFKDHLYRNDNGRFVEVSEEAGISRNVAYGLSVNASDFNNDGWMDLYVANDYAEPDFMYYNNGDGTFKNVINEKLKHITQLSMGSDTGDINNDGLLDLITTDMTPEDHYRGKTNMASMSTEAFRTMVDAGAHYQYMANALHVNSGIETFSDIGNMAGIAYTDWSWASLIVDLDNDGLKDIIISNGIKKDVDNNDYRNKVKNLSKDATLEELFQLSKNTPSQPVSNYAFKNLGNYNFKKVSKEWGFDTPSFSNGMAYADLDNDGDLDVITNNMDAPAFIYRNKSTGNFLKIRLEGTGQNKFGLGAKATIYYQDGQQVVENSLTRGFISSIEPGMFFGLGNIKKVDKVEVLWPNGKTNLFENIEANQVIIAKQSEALNQNQKDYDQKQLLSKIDASDIGIDFVHQENEYDEYLTEVLLPHNVSQNGPFSAVGDVNGDGLNDIFIGGASNQSGKLYLQIENNSYMQAKYQPWQNEIESEDLGCLFLDVDGDKDLDLYVASGGSEFKEGDKRYQDRLYVNDGNGQFKIDNSILPKLYNSTQSVKSSDIDNDGDLDLFIGTRLVPGKYAYPATSYILINDNGTFRKADKSTAPALDNIGMVTDAVFTDIDQDNDEDLIIVGEWMSVMVLENDKGVFSNSTDSFGLDSNTRGIWWSITASDLDGDGDEDYILGNLGKNNKFKASKEHPFKVYANDFDENGTNDIVLAKFYKDDYVPVRGRECTSQQMPYVAEKFKDYDSFASSKLIDILPEDKVDDAVVYEIESFQSIILKNEGGKLVKSVLPNQVQVSPIKSSYVYDVNNDGIKDILLVGNHYGVEVETTRYDAGYGAILIGTKDGDFDFMSPNLSGFYVPEDMRQIVKMDSGFMVLTNNSSPKFFSLTK